MRSTVLTAALCVAAITLCAAKRPAKVVKKPVSQPIDQHVLRVQVLLDRAHFSPGQIDASVGNVTHLMLAAFQSQHNLPTSGNPDDATVSALEAAQSQQGATTTIDYTIVYDDVRGPFVQRPGSMMDQAKLDTLGYSSPWDALGEKFHSSPELLHRLNPQVKSFKPGDHIQVPNIHHDVPHGVVTISVSKGARMVQALDSNNKPIACYPATIGSVHDPLPIGNYKVVRVEWNPTFYYNPQLFWNAGPKDSKATIKPGPRNPVGAVWISLNLEHYGIHGTPDPAGIGHETSHGCVRLTNWDATEVAQMVSPGMPVIFKE